MYVFNLYVECVVFGLEGLCIQDYVDPRLLFSMGVLRRRCNAVPYPPGQERYSLEEKESRLVKVQSMDTCTVDLTGYYVDY